MQHRWPFQIIDNEHLERSWMLCIRNNAQMTKVAHNQSVECVRIKTVGNKKFKNAEASHASNQ